MSVVATAIVDWIVDRWLYLKWPDLCFTSYVDNCEVMATQLSQVLAGIDGLNQICQCLDLELDHAKTYAWALTGDDRRTFRDASVGTKLDGRNLGGHLQYSRQHTNFTVTS